MLHSFCSLVFTLFACVLLCIVLGGLPFSFGDVSSDQLNLAKQRMKRDKVFDNRDSKIFEPPFSKTPSHQSTIKTMVFAAAAAAAARGASKGRAVAPRVIQLLRNMSTKNRADLLAGSG